MEHEVHIKGMVSGRCISIIKEGVIKLGLDLKVINMGRVSLGTTISDDDQYKLEEFLMNHGFETVITWQERILSQVNSPTYANKNLKVVN